MEVLFFNLSLKLAILQGFSCPDPGQPQGLRLLVLSGFPFAIR